MNMNINGCTLAMLVGQNNEIFISYKSMFNLGGFGG